MAVKRELACGLEWLTVSNVTWWDWSTDVSEQHCRCHASRPSARAAPDYSQQMAGSASLGYVEELALTIP